MSNSKLSLRCLAVAALLMATMAMPTTLDAAAQTVAPVTPMTPDAVANYEEARPEADYIKRVAMVPMRDGVKLYTVIVMKKGASKAPMLLSRTPYGAKDTTARIKSQSVSDILPVMDSPFIEDNYIRIYQDIRGLHDSEGVFIMNRPIRGPLNDSGIDESTDAYDTIDWLIKHVPEGNGKVGVLGNSYLGFTALMAEVGAHPALKVAVVESPMVDGWMGDDWFHNGAFRNTSFAYIVGQSTAKAEASAAPAVGVGDDYTRYLEAGSSGDYARRWGIDQYPFVRKVMNNPAYASFWALQAVDQWLAARPLSVPTLLVVGQWDQEDSYGAAAVYRALKPKDSTDNLVSLVIGPWWHGGVEHFGFGLGALTFTGDTAAEFREQYLKPYLDHYLKDAPNPAEFHVLTYATGINRWETSPRWPAGALTPLYLDRDHTANFAVPTVSGHDDYPSDPSKPVPFLPRPIDMTDVAQWRPWLVHDQRFASDRPDVLVYQTATLTTPLHIMGAPQVDLYAATSGTDSDWVVKLIDVFPNTPPELDQGSRPSMAGMELPIGIEIFRGRYLRGFGSPQPLVPGKVEKYQFALPNVDHVFLPGHRVMIQVQSTLFPVYDRNPQSYVENIFNARAADYQSVTQSVYRGGDKASSVLLPIAR